jgi:predicted DNA-binding ribbon-helix-helix protein
MTDTGEARSQEVRSVRLQKPLWAALRDLAQTEGVTVNRLIHDAIVALLQRRGFDLGDNP